jgi:hypothetical protein
MVTDPVKFYLVKDRGPANLGQDIENIFNYLGTINDITLKKETDKVTIGYSQTPLTATLAGTDSSAKDMVVSSQMILTCDKSDNVTVNLLKLALRNSDYRIFNPLTGSYMVTSPDLLDLTTVKLEPKISKIFSHYGFTPLFNYQNSLIYFAKNKKDKSIHLINRHLLEYLTGSRGKLKKQENFGLKVADNTGEFVALFDRGIIPTSFYTLLNRPKRVVNQSGFDIERFNTNTFVTFAFFTFDKEKQRFTQVSSAKLPEGITLIKKGNSLEKFIDKTIKMGNPKAKILGVKISGQVTFEKREKDKLTPLLLVSVFLDKV